MFGNIKRRVLVLGAVAIVATSTATVVLAETPTPGATSGKTDYAQVFLGKLAAILNVDQTTLANDIKQASKDTVDQEVKDGRLTQAQADNVRSRMDQGRGRLRLRRAFRFRT